MLLIFNCKSIYGTEIPFMADELKYLGHRLAIIGGPTDSKSGDMMRAQSSLRCDTVISAQEDFTDFRMQAISEAQIEFENPVTLMISDDARDLAAADMLSIPTISPFDFDFDHLGGSDGS